MNKNITHKEHRQLLSELYKRQGGKWIYQADAYIKQQEKKEKLLELYKEYYELDRMYVKNNFFLELENLNRRSEILEEIKELEK